MRLKSDGWHEGQRNEKLPPAGWKVQKESDIESFSMLKEEREQESFSKTYFIQVKTWI